MSRDLTSLWSDQIRPKILSPRAILKAQAEALAQQTGGLLLAEIKENQLDNGMVKLDFSIVAPALEGYRHRVLTVAHQMDLPYPSVVDSQIFRHLHPDSRESLQRALETGKLPLAYRADSDEEFIQFVQQILTSSSVLSVAQSLIARASEAVTENQPQPQTSPMENDLP